MTKFIIKFMAISLLLCTSCRAEDKIPELGQYKALLDYVKNSDQKQSLEGVFFLAQSLPLSRIKDPVEGLKTANSIENWNIAVDSNYMLNLAKKSGTEKDTAFYEAYNTTTKNDQPLYLKPAGKKHCVDYVAPNLQDSYIPWLRFTEGVYLPANFEIGTYNGYATSRLLDFERDMKQNNCSCNSEIETLAGLKAFIGDLEKSKSPESDTPTGIKLARERMFALLKSGKGFKYNGGCR